MGYRDNEYGRLRKVLLCKPTYFKWVEINEVAKKNINEPEIPFDYEAAIKNHNEMVDALKSFGVEVSFIETSEPHHYQVYTRDIGKNLDEGVLIGRMRLPVRIGEDDIFKEYLIKNGIPIFNRISVGAFEGGDVHFIDKNTLVVGIGSRSTLEGINQAKELLKPKGIDVIPVEFEEKYLHLDLLFVVIADRACLLCKEGVPESFVKMLEDRKYEMVYVPKEDAMELKNNVLALGDDTVLSFKNNIKVNQQLRALGFNILDPDLDMFTRGGGGPRCLTFPLERDEI